MTEDEKDFQRRCDNFAAVEGAAVMAAIAKMDEVSPDFCAIERADELVAALVAGAWRTLLMHNKASEVPFSSKDLQSVFIDHFVTRILRRSPELPETKPS